MKNFGHFFGTKHSLTAGSVLLGQNDPMNCSFLLLFFETKPMNCSDRAKIAVGNQLVIGRHGREQRPRQVSANRQEATDVPQAGPRSKGEPAAAHNHARENCMI